MIKLNRDTKPAILVNNEKSWTTNLVDAVTNFGEYSKIPKEQKEKLLVHYRHQEIKNVLFQSSLQKCAFCETKPGESGNIEVEHFAPKSIYPELAFKWENFLPACRKCNGSKDDHDTLNNPIINPYDTNPEEIFHYNDIQIAANDAHEEIGKLTIRVCGLNSVRLMKPRADILVSLHSFSQALDEAIRDYEEAATDIKKQHRKRKIREAVEAIEVLANPSEKFSGFCKEYLKKCAAYHEAKSIVGE
ncbi:HNH endonuclease [Pseudomonas sediminis]|uniref:HNH endonuclease n=1 Tax=Pseudomonas sediminis TaxID=1691904 RepID=A0ABX6SET1_9PSED|nr:HNH endonuclease [Pseudomonas sediminis]QNG99910.1 HNH endonuclease [Pseudomonas sediminis]